MLTNVEGFSPNFSIRLQRLIVHHTSCAKTWKLYGPWRSQ